MTSVGAVLLSFLSTLVLTGLFLVGLFFVVRAAVEQGVRRSLPDAALRPSVREQLMRRDEEQ